MRTSPPSFLVAVIGIAAACMSLPASARAQADAEPAGARKPLTRTPNKVRMVAVVRGSGAGSDKAAGFVDHFMRELLDEDERYDVLPLDEALGSAAASEGKQAIARAETLFAQGREAYDTLDLDVAIERLNDALRDLEQHAAYLQDIGKVADVLMLLGATHILRGEDGKGRERLMQAIAIAPDVEPDPAVFNPTMRNTFRSASNSVKKSKRVALSVSSNPSYAQVYVDGNFAGVSPITVDGLTEGRHFLRLVKDGYNDFGSVVSVSRSSEVAEVAHMQPAQNFEDYDALVDQVLAAQGGGRLNAEHATLVERLGRMLGVDHLFVASVRLDGERVVVEATQLDLESEIRVKTATHSFAYDTQQATYEREISTLMRTHFSPETLTQSTDGAKTYGGWGNDAGLVHAASSVCPMGMSCDAFRGRMLMLGGLGGGGLLVLGGVFAMLGYQDYEDFKTKAQGSSEANSLESSGKLKAVLGDTFLTLGVLGIVGTATLYFYFQPSATPDDVVAGSGSAAFDFSLAPLKSGAAFSATVRF